MTKEISEAAYIKAHDAAYDDQLDAPVAQKVQDMKDSYIGTAFARFIQEVSDAVKRAKGNRSPEADEILAPFILPEPVDPLLEELPALFEAAKERLGQGEGYTRADIITKGGHEMWEARVALAALKRGIEIGEARK